MVKDSDSDMTGAVMGRRESHSGKEGVGSRRTCGPAGSPVCRDPRAPVEGLPTNPDFYRCVQ